jgi:hypothetical protein
VSLALFKSDSVWLASRLQRSKRRVETNTYYSVSYSAREDKQRAVVHADKSFQSYRLIKKARETPFVQDPLLLPRELSIEHSRVLRTVYYFCYNIVNYPGAYSMAISAGSIFSSWMPASRFLPDIPLTISSTFNNMHAASMAVLMV